MGSKDSELQPIVSKPIGTHNKPVSALTGVHGLEGDSNVQISRVSLAGLFPFCYI